MGFKGQTGTSMQGKILHTKRKHGKESKSLGKLSGGNIGRWKPRTKDQKEEFVKKFPVIKSKLSQEEIDAKFPRR